jgi:hypothetical protein
MISGSVSKTSNRNASHHVNKWMAHLMERQFRHNNWARRYILGDAPFPVDPFSSPEADGTLELAYNSTTGLITIDSYDLSSVAESCSCGRGGCGDNLCHHDHHELCHEHGCNHNHGNYNENHQRLGHVNHGHYDHGHDNHVGHTHHRDGHHKQCGHIPHGWHDHYGNHSWHNNHQHGGYGPNAYHDDWHAPSGHTGGGNGGCSNGGCGDEHQGHRWRGDRDDVWFCNDGGRSSSSNGGGGGGGGCTSGNCGSVDRCTDKCGGHRHDHGHGHGHGHGGCHDGGCKDVECHNHSYGHQCKNPVKIIHIDCPPQVRDLKKIIYLHNLTSDNDNDDCDGCKKLSVRVYLSNNGHRLPGPGPGFYLVPAGEVRYLMIEFGRIISIEN